MLFDPIAYTIARVARGYGQSFTATLDSDFADVLAADLALDELERVDGFHAATARLHQAQLTHIATNAKDPGRELARIADALRTDMQRLPQMANPDEIAAATEAIERAVRIDRRSRRKRGKRG